MNFSPHTHKYFGVLIAVIVLAVIILGVRVGKLNELSATVSSGRTAIASQTKTVPQYDTAKRFLDVLKQSHQASPQEVTQFFKAGKLPKTTKSVAPKKP